MCSIICFSHLRWNFVYQRPQHLMSRLSERFRVFFIEEPVYETGSAYNAVSKDAGSEVWIVVPHLPSGLLDEEIKIWQTRLLSDLLATIDDDYILWYYSPLALSFSAGLQPLLTVYDCMDELSAFRFAPPLLRQREVELLLKADLVFTGGYSLYDAKKQFHPATYCFPSSIDKPHFARARQWEKDPADQLAIRFPRLGFFGVIDERIDYDLLAAVADLRKDWQQVLVGPTVKVDPQSLPRRDNIHYLGMKQYAELPAYLGGWDIAIMPFALNDATRFISPTKTPEYLAGGKPVISTPVKDVVHAYGDLPMVKIAGSPAEFVAAAEYLLANKNRGDWLEQTDRLLADMSWDKTARDMMDLMENKMARDVAV